jgi:hypothetical protein
VASTTWLKTFTASTESTGFPKVCKFTRLDKVIISVCPVKLYGHGTGRKASYLPGGTTINARLTTVTKINDVEILPIQIIPTSVYKIGTGEGFRLRYGAELDSEDLLVIAIKAAIKDPKRIAEAVEKFLGDL